MALDKQFEKFYLKNKESIDPDIYQDIRDRVYYLVAREYIDEAQAIVVMNRMLDLYLKKEKERKNEQIPT